MTLEARMQAWMQAGLSKEEAFTKVEADIAAELQTLLANPHFMGVLITVPANKHEHLPDMGDYFVSRKLKPFVLEAALTVDGEEGCTSTPLFRRPS